MAWSRRLHVRIKSYIFTSLFSRNQFIQIYVIGESVKNVHIYFRKFSLISKLDVLGLGLAKLPKAKGGGIR